MARYLADIIGRVKQHLRDEFVTGVSEEWTKDELRVYVDDCLYEISEAAPYRVKEVHPMVEDFREIDVSDITNLIRIDAVEYKVGQRPRDFRNFTWVDAETIELEIDALPDGGSSGTLTGTVTFTDASATVTGSGTDFDGELATGSFIRNSTSSRTRWYRVASIASDTSLTLCENVHSTDAGADTVDVTPYYDKEVCYIYCDKLHDLTDSSSTLTPPMERILILGVSGKAAIARGRYLLNKVNVGGSEVGKKMEAWGILKVAEYNREVSGLRKPRSRKLYPRD